MLCTVLACCHVKQHCRHLWRQHSFMNSTVNAQAPQQVRPSPWRGKDAFHASPHSVTVAVSMPQTNWHSAAASAHTSSHTHACTLVGSGAACTGYTIFGTHAKVVSCCRPRRGHGCSRYNPAATCAARHLSCDTVHDTGPCDDAQSTHICTGALLKLGLLHHCTTTKWFDNSQCGC